MTTSLTSCPGYFPGFPRRLSTVHFCAWLMLVAAVVAAAAPATVRAQAYQCRMPTHIPVPQAKVDGKLRRLPVTGYTLALSWSPEYCKLRGRSSGDSVQCSGKNGRFGFIVHGLWPESGTSWPQWCARIPRLTPREVRRNMCMIPSARLQVHEWSKHGSCMTRRPETYFKVTRILWNSLRLPDMEALSREKGLHAGRLRSVFVAANKGWRREAIGIKRNKRGWLKELWLCYDKRFRPVRCDARRFGARDQSSLKIWRGL